MGAEIKSLVLDTWAGRRYYAVELVGQTPKKARVRILTPGGVMLPGRRYVNYGETVLVPKYAVVDLPKDTNKVEQGYYDGHRNSTEAATPRSGCVAERTEAHCDR